MNILLTSAGRRTYMVDYFKRALDITGGGKVYASNSILTNTLLSADGYTLTPNIYDVDYIGFLIDFCESKNISAIISLFDIDLPILSKHKDEFERRGIKVIVSSYDVTQICNDKWLTYKFLSRIGLDQPHTFINLEEANKSIECGILDYPFYLKPRWGMGSIGIYRVESDDELSVLYKRLKREIFETYLKYESSIDIEACILIQEGMKGMEYGIEVLNDLNANYVKTFAKRKIAMRSGETDIAETVNSAPFEELGKLLSSNLKHVALLDVDCFVDEDDSIRVLEMNCRFGGQYPFTHNSGVNVPLQIVKWLNGDEVDSSILTQKNSIISCKELVPTIMNNDDNNLRR